MGAVAQPLKELASVGKNEIIQFKLRLKVAMLNLLIDCPVLDVSFCFTTVLKSMEDQGYSKLSTCLGPITQGPTCLRLQLITNLLLCYGTLSLINKDFIGKKKGRSSERHKKSKLVLDSNVL